MASRLLKSKKKQGCRDSGKSKQRGPTQIFTSVICEKVKDNIKRKAENSFVECVADSLKFSAPDRNKILPMDIFISGSHVVAFSSTSKIWRRRKRTWTR